MLFLLLLSLLGAVLAVFSYCQLRKENPSAWWIPAGIFGVVTFFYPPIVIGVIHGVISLFNRDIYQVPAFDYTSTFLPSPFSLLVLLLAGVFFWKLHRDAKRNGKSLHEWIMQHKPSDEQMESGDPFDNLYKAATDVQREKEEKRSQSPSQLDQTD